MTLLQYLEKQYKKGQIFTFDNLPKYLQTNSTIVQLSRLSKKEKIIHIAKGAYAIPPLKNKPLKYKKPRPTMKHQNYSDKLVLYEKLNQNGAFWSGKINNKKKLNESDDDILIEKGLLYLEFEEMHLLFKAYPKNKVKKYWREKLVPQKERYDIINRLLGILFFDIKNIDKYLMCHAKQ